MAGRPGESELRTAIDVKACLGLAYRSFENGMALSLKPTSNGESPASVSQMVAWRARSFIDPVTLRSSALAKRTVPDAGAMSC